MNKIKYIIPQVAVEQMQISQIICSSPNGSPDDDLNKGGNPDNFVSGRKLYV